METKNAVTLSTVKDEKTFFLIIPADSTYGVAYDATFELLGALMEMQKKSLEALDKSKKEEPK